MCNPTLIILGLPVSRASSSKASRASRMKQKKSSAVENARPGANLLSFVHSVYGTTKCQAEPPGEGTLVQ